MAELDDAEQVGTMLEELHELVTPAAWNRIDGVLRRVVALYGKGLANVLEHARAAGADASLEDRLCDDSLVASLLVIHGLHPRGPARRIESALAQVATQLGRDIPSLELIAFEADGTVRLRTQGTFGGGAVSARVAEAAVRRAIEAAVPEVTRIEISGLPPPRDPTLVQLRRSRESAR
jgi:Fe-S cluster biogenesis protein NfuA